MVSCIYDHTPVYKKVSIYIYLYTETWKKETKFENRWAWHGGCPSCVLPGWAYIQTESGLCNKTEYPAWQIESSLWVREFARTYVTFPVRHVFLLPPHIPKIREVSYISTLQFRQDDILFENLYLEDLPPSSKSICEPKIQEAYLQQKKNKLISNHSNYIFLEGEITEYLPKWRYKLKKRDSSGHP